MYFITITLLITVTYFINCTIFIQAAFIVALCNLSIPINLQYVINTILQFARDGIPFDFEKLAKPLSKLLVLYVTQVKLY